VTTVPPENRDFAEQVAASRLQDPMPTLRELSRVTGVPEIDLIHHALVRYTAAGSEAIMALEPQVLRDLARARAREDWASVAGIIDWLEAGG
jgi:hypothetical protein